MAFDEKKFVGADALSELSTKVKTELDKKTNKAGSLTNVSYDTANKKFTKTTQGAHDPVTTDIVSTSTLKTDMGIADFDGTFNSLKSKPTTISGYGITDAKVQNSTVTIGSNSVTALTQDDVSSTYDSSGTSPVDGKAVAAALGTLDVESVGGAGKYISAISETDGKISATAETMDSTPTSSSTKAVTSDGIYEYVNSSVATNTAYFIGTFDSVEELEAYSGIITNNDYAFVTSTDSSGNTLYNRYKYNGSTHTWSFEYALNNSSFTSAQWATIQSGLTSSDKTKLNGIQSGANKTIVDAAMSSSSTNPVQNKVVNTALAGKQDTLTFDSTPTQSSTNPVTSAGIYTDQVRQDALEAQDRAALVEVENKGAKNILKTYDIPETTSGNVVFSIIDGVCSVSTTATQTTARILVYAMDTDVGITTVNSRYTIPRGTYVLKTTGNAKVKLRAIEHDGTNTNLLAETTGSDVEFTYSGTMPYVVFTLHVSSNTSLSETVTFIPMCCLKAEYIIDQTAVKYGKTNAELTLLEQQDRDALKAMDKTYSKNIADMSKVPVKVRSAEGVVVTITDDGTILASGTSSSNNNIFFNIFYNDTNTVMVPSGTWVAKLYGTGSENFRIEGSDSVHTSVYRGDFGKPFEFTVADGVTYSLIRICAKPNTDFTGTSMKLMICSKGEWNISQDYVPYGMTNLDLTTFTRSIANRGSKNVAEVTAVSSSAGGVDYIVNPDGTVIANRTTSSTTSTWFRLNPSLSLKAGT